MACCEAHWAGISTPRTKRKPGTKRLSRLLHCAKWSAELIRQYHGPRATKRLTAWKNAGLDAAFHLGRECVGEAGKHCARRVWPGTFEQSHPAHAQQEGLLHPAARSHFRAGTDTRWRWSWWAAKSLLIPPRLSTMGWWTSRGHSSVLQTR